MTPVKGGTTPDDVTAGPREPGTATRAALLVGGCATLGTGVALLLAAALGSDGYSTLVNGIALSTGISFLVANTLVSLAFLTLAWMRGLRPGIGTVVQIVVVGVTVWLLLEALPTPDSLLARAALLVLAFPVIAVGIVCYLGSRTGAGPAEAFALAWDPPLPFRWSYSIIQGGGALVGWLLGAAAGLGTLAVILALGPLVDLTARLLRLNVDQERSPDKTKGPPPPEG
ncbi:MAG: hypothetical protein ACXWDI_14995 [Nocardioides sp.]